MKIDLTKINIFANGEIEKTAETFFEEELELRTGKKPTANENIDKFNVTFVIEKSNDCEDFEIRQNENRIEIIAHRLRGLIYGYSFLLRKCIVENGKIFLVKNISCHRYPSMKIRGHQIGYSDMSNTYDAWNMNTFERYIRDMMYFGINMVEGITGKEEKNSMMLYSAPQVLEGMSKICCKLDIDFSVWHPLSKDETDEETIEDIKTQFAKVPKVDVIFPPGGDPGDLLAQDFVERCKAIKKSFPKIQMWPSAQAPHEYADWGERFTEKMNELPQEIDGLIYGPNHAMPLDEMRRKMDSRYPIRLYPDIAHNVRCEVPVHFNRDDWHYAYASTLSREAVNPRPSEYRLFHRVTRQYVCGCVTYSEGNNDDLNKMIWSEMDFDFNSDLRESVRDYCRVFCPTADTEKMTDAIFALELNWVGDPAENSSVDNAYNAFISLKNDNPMLMKNWRFVLHLFRAQCDKIVRERRIFELGLIDEARTEIYCGNLEKAKEILSTDFCDEYKTLRVQLDEYAKILFNQIGIQLDVKNFNGMSWERGCTLDTIDNAVTDRRWLLDKIKNENSAENARAYFDRNKVETDEYYFSFAEHGFDVCGRQEGEYYYDFCGDSDFDAKLPMCMTKVYDHFNFKTNVAGLTGGDYRLRLTYKERPNDKITHHKISINSRIIYDGKQFGGERDEDYEKKFLASGFESIVYDIKKEWIENGCVVLEITEPIDGFMISEFSFTKKK